MSDRFARIDEASDWLGAWLADAAGAAVPPRAPGDDRVALGCLLVGLAPAAAAPGVTARFLARFLVWAAPGDATAQKRLTAVVFAAIADRPRIELDLLPSPSLLAAFAPGRVGVVLALPIEQIPAAKPAPLVTEPLVLQRVPIGALAGVIVADDKPLPRATVEIPALALRTATDARGAFRFPSVPAGREATLVVRARGRELTVSATTSPVTIDFPLTEG